MDEKIQKIQTKIINLLKSTEGRENIKLSELCRDSCSELSRLASFWLYELEKNANYMVLKGGKVINGDSHDVLCVEFEDKFYVIDPSVWQFFPNKKQILIDVYNSMEEVLLKLANVYGGEWNVSEYINTSSFDDKDEWVKIIKENIN